MQNDRIKQLRGKIDAVDIRLLDLLNERIRISARIGEMKLIDNRPVIDPEREKKLFSTLEKEAALRNLDFSFVRKVWQEILNQSYQAQTKERSE